MITANFLGNLCCLKQETLQNALVMEKAISDEVISFHGPPGKIEEYLSDISSLIS